MTGTDADRPPGGADDSLWPEVTLRWGPMAVALRSNSPQVLAWAQQCFTAEAAAGPAEVTDRAVVSIDDEVARARSADCTRPLPGGERLQVGCGENDGMELVRVTATQAPSHRSKRTWPLVLVFGQAPGGDVHGFGSSDPQGNRAGEMLVRQILDRHLIGREAAVLHAAGVVLDGRAVLLVGETGFGKTTLATWGTVMRGGRFLAGDRAAAYLDGETPVAVGFARSTRYGPGTIQALIGTEDWLQRLPRPGLNQMMGLPTDGKVGREFKIVLNNAELGALGMRTADAAPLAGIVVLEQPGDAAMDVTRLAGGEAADAVRPHLRQSFDLLPPLDRPEGSRTYGASGDRLAGLLERVPVLRARWRLDRDDPAALFDAVHEGLLAGAAPTG